MKPTKIALILSGLLLNLSAYAADNPVYIGISVGETRINRDVDGTYDAAKTATVTAGYIYSDSTSLQSIIEASYTQTLSKENVTINGAADEYKEETLGLFLATRTKSDTYLKAKIGAVDHRITTNNVVSYDSVKLSVGIGFGIKLESGGTTEIEYVVYDDDISLVNIGYLF